MSTRRPRYSKEEFARRGTELYENNIRPHVEAEHKGGIVAINIESGEYAIGENILAASRSLFDKDADAQVWSVRVGYPAVSRTGLRSSSRSAI